MRILNCEKMYLNIFYLNKIWIVFSIDDTAQDIPESLKIIHFSTLAANVHH